MQDTTIVEIAAPRESSPEAPPAMRVEPRRRTKSLLMWSGGLDSTYGLLRLLSQTDDEVHAHHVHLNALGAGGERRSRRGEFESAAVTRMLTRLRSQCRPFAYSESRVDATAFSRCAAGTTMAMFFAAQVALSHGYTPFDRIVLGVNSDPGSAWRPHTYACAFRRLVTVGMLKAVWEADEVPYLYLWSPRPSRREEAVYLGDDLLDLTANCDDPVAAADDGLGHVIPRPCGQCAQCAQIQPIVRARAGAAAQTRQGPPPLSRSST